MSDCLSAFLHVCLPVCRSVVCLSACLNVCLPFCLSVCQCVSIGLSVCLSVSGFLIQVLRDNDEFQICIWNICFCLIWNESRQP